MQREVCALRIEHIIGILESSTTAMQKPAAMVIVERYGRNPFCILISCLLSLRARDSFSLPIALHVLSRAPTPAAMQKLPLPTLEKMLYSLGFYKSKARLLHSVSSELIERFEGQVPSREEELLSIRGIGRKTAELVRGYAFGIPSLCVDTHVHRIANRLGLVSTKTPHQTEIALKQIVPEKYWISLNRLIVMWGQNICVPISPFCSRCPLMPLCARRGVKISR